MAGRTQDPQREKKAASGGSARADGAKTTTGRTKAATKATGARSRSAAAGTTATAKKKPTGAAASAATSAAATSASTKGASAKSATAKKTTSKKTTPKKSTGADAATRTDYYRQMALIREFEQRAGEMYQRAKIGGYCHLNLGEEPTVVGLMTALRPTDYLFTNYRDHGYAIARGLGADRVMAELFGRTDGVAKGLGGSMHMYDAEKRMLGGYGIVGGQIPPATGAALALTFRGEPGPDAEAVMCQMGDGTTNIGAFHEALNIAAIWKLPIVYVIINNGLGMATTVEAASGEPELYKRGCAYRIPGKRVDGSDPEEVRKAAEEMLTAAREKRQPGILEVMSYRLRGHSVVDPARYRTKEEVAELKEHDPLPPYRAQLIADGVLDEKAADALEGDAAKEVADAIAFADASAEPAPKTLFDFTYATDVPNASRMMPGDPVLPVGWDREPVGAGKEA